MNGWPSHDRSLQFEPSALEDRYFSAQYSENICDNTQPEDASRRQVESYPRDNLCDQN